MSTLTEWWRHIRRLEPARVRAAWAALIAAAAALGITVTADTDRVVQAVIVAFFAVLPLLQGEATRRKVIPVAKLEDAMTAEETGHGDIPTELGE